MEEKHGCGDCIHSYGDGDYGTIQSCNMDDVDGHSVTFTENDELEVDGKIYDWDECPLWNYREG